MIRRPANTRLKIDSNLYFDKVLGIGSFNENKIQQSNILRDFAYNEHAHMIIYDLSCDNDHKFEGWFRSAGDFELQLETHLITCPQCDSHAVRRIPSAVAISSHAINNDAISGAAASAGSGTALMPVGVQAMALYRQLVQAIVENSEDVGPSFAEEARKIHYNEAPERAIRGQATADECEALRDEGIQILHVPAAKEEDLN